MHNGHPWVPFSIIFINPLVSLLAHGLSADSEALEKRN